MDQAEQNQRITSPNHGPFWPKKIPKRVWGAFAFDVLMIGLPFMGTFVLALNALWYGPQALFLRKNVPVARLKSGLFFTYILAMLCIFTACVANRWIGEHNALHIADAVVAFEEDKGHYPADLGALTPEYITFIPPAGILFPFAYTYHPPSNLTSEKPNGPTLLWTSLCLFGRSTYNIPEKRWGYLD